MKRTFDREAPLPAFKIDVGDLGAILKELRPHFAGNDISISIDISLPGEDLDFNSVEELEKNQNLLPDTVTDFGFSMFSYISPTERQRVSVSRFGRRPDVKVSSTNEAWCAGAVSIVQKYISQKNQWYASIRDWHFTTIPIVVGFLPLILLKTAHIQMLSGYWSLASFGLLIIFSWVLPFVYYRIFPGRTLVIRNQEGWLRKHSGELTLGLALLSLIVSVIGLFRK